MVEYVERAFILVWHADIDDPCMTVLPESFLASYGDALVAARIRFDDYEISADNAELYTKLDCSSIDCFIASYLDIRAKSKGFMSSIALNISALAAEPRAKIDALIQSMPHLYLRAKNPIVDIRAILPELESIVRGNILGIIDLRRLDPQNKEFDALVA